MPGNAPFVMSFTITNPAGNTTINMDPAVWNSITVDGQNFNTMNCKVEVKDVDGGTKFTVEDFLATPHGSTIQQVTRFHRNPAFHDVTPIFVTVTITNNPDGNIQRGISRPQPYDPV